MECNNEDVVIGKNNIKRLLVEENVKKVQELLDQKVPIRAIARQMNCSALTIKNLIKLKGLKIGELKQGAPRTSKAHLPENVEKIKTLCENGYSLRAISRAIGCSVDIIYIILRENNIYGYTVEK